MSDRLAPEAIATILDRLVGTTVPQGDTRLDEKSQNNVPAFGAVCDWVAGRINQAYRSIDSPYASERRTAEMVADAACDLALCWDVDHGRCCWLKKVDE